MMYDSLEWYVLKRKRCFAMGNGDDAMALRIQSIAFGSKAPKTEKTMGRQTCPSTECLSYF